MWFSRNILFATATLVALILFFSSQVASEACQTIIKTCSSTKTIRPSNCPIQTTTTATFKTSTVSTTTTTSFTTTTTTVTTNVFEKRTQNVICIPEKDCTTYHNKGKCTKVFHCTPTITLPCPKVSTKILPTTVTSTSISVSVIESTITALTTTTSINSCCDPTVLQKNSILLVASRAFLNYIPSASDPQACCIACAQNPNCYQWIFDESCAYEDDAIDSICSPMTAQPIPAGYGGVMRCNGGCLST